jgi:hypothetical protein
VEHEPAQAPLHHPAPFQNVKAAGLGLSGDDFDIDAEGGSVIDGGVS